MSFSKGDTVTWNTSQGTTDGRIVEKRVKEFEFSDHKFNASEDEPYYIVESAKTGAKAAHKESALSRK